jgi:hypothetical protein
VLILEGASELMQKASKVNQARLHTGLHYPRSLMTARDSLRYFERFEKEFHPAVKRFRQIYAVSRWNSQTNSQQFARFINNIGLSVSEVNPNLYFNEGTVDSSFEVDEPTFDSSVLRDLLLTQCETQPRLEIRTNSQVLGLRMSGENFIVDGTFSTPVLAKGIVFATYANLNGCRAMLELSKLPLRYELAQVLLGSMTNEYAGLGFTIMDGPFWSLMPFGNLNQHSLTSVGLTPRETNLSEPIFDCQTIRSDCRESFLKDCSTCTARPKSSYEHFVKQMALHFRDYKSFAYEESLFTVKTVLKSATVDDARPTLIIKEPMMNVWTIFSGKVSTLFDLEGSLN